MTNVNDLQPKRKTKSMRVKTKAWFPYGRNDRSTTIAEIEKFLSLRSLRSRVATIAKNAECMFPYARKDRSDRCDRCAAIVAIVAIVAIIWKPGLNIHCALSRDTLSPLHDMTTKPYTEQENGDEEKITNMPFFPKSFDWFMQCKVKFRKMH